MISSDLPITNSSEDILNRSTFANSLAKTILKHSFSSSFTIGLYGEWGSGKTSLLNMVFENIESADNTAIILRFNPWLCADPKQLIIQFFKQLAAAIKLKKPHKEKAWELVDQYADLFEATNAIPYVGFLVSALGKTIGQKAKDEVKKQSVDLQKNKDQIIKKLIELKTKIVVSIDDIDRLSENEIIAVFQLVKALADFPNTVYILAFDYDVVVRALSKVQHGDGKEYLEKIIQVPFEIPAPDMTSIQKTLFSKLDDILSDMQEERWSNAIWADLYRYGFQKYIKSIRDVIRFINVFTLKYDLLKDETNPLDLLGLTLLQVFEPSTYSKLPHYKTLICGDNSHYSSARQREQGEKLKNAHSLLLPNDGTVRDNEAATNTLSILFPRIKTTASSLYSIGRYYSRRDFLINNNIAIPECFDRYFALSLESNAIPTAIIKNLIYESDEDAFSEGVLQLYQDGKIIRFLEELDAYVNRTNSAIPEARAILIIRVLTRNWGKFEVDERDFWFMPFSWRLQFCVNPLLKGMNSEARFDCIKTVFNDVIVQPSTLAILLGDFERKLGRFTDSTPNTDDAILTLDEVLELEGIFRSRAINVIESGSVFDQYQGLNFMWLLGKIDAESVTKIQKSIIKDDYSLVKVISYCSSKGTTATNVVTKTRYVNCENLKAFIGIDEAYNRIIKYTKTEEFRRMPIDDQISTIAFRLIKEQDSTEPESEKYVSEETIIRILNQM